MKILHLISSLDPKAGGPVEGLRQLARAALEWGDETTVLTLDAPGQPYHEGEAYSVVALGPAFLKYRYSPRLVPWLRRHAAEYDAVVVNGIWQYVSFAAWRALRGGPVPYFVYTHGMLDPYFKRAFPLKHLKKSAYWVWADYRVLRDARRVFFTCEEERLLARQSFSRYRAREVVVGYGTSAPPEDRDSALQEFHARHSRLRGVRYLLYLGRIHEKKGCDLLLRAFAAVAGEDATVQLVMAGPGDAALVSALQALAEQLGIARRVVWTGMLSGPAKWGALYGAEAFVLPSHQENFGIAVVEALACGTPVLISNQVNIWREISAAGAGFVAEDTLGGTTQLLRQWLALEAQPLAAMRAASQACFESHFHIRQAARRLADAIADARYATSG